MNRISRDCENCVCVCVCVCVGIYIVMMYLCRYDSHQSDHLVTTAVIYNENTLTTPAVARATARCGKQHTDAINQALLAITARKSQLSNGLRLHRIHRHTGET